MLRWISMFGGLLIMMGHHPRSEALFYYFRLEDQIPENHLLRLIDKHISFEFVRQQLKDSYSETGRPSIDPELLLRILLIGYLYGITSERKLATMHQRCLPGPHHPPERTRPATCAGVGRHTRVRPSTAAKEKGGSLVRGTEESDQAAPPAAAEIKVRT
jgi:hypothetical protein